MTPVRLEPATPRSRVKLSTTEPLHSLIKRLKNRTLTHSAESTQISTVKTNILQNIKANRQDEQYTFRMNMDGLY